MPFSKPADPASPYKKIPAAKLPTHLEPFTDPRPRYLYWRALEEHTPQVLEHLRDVVLPVYRSLSNDVARQSYAKVGLRPKEKIGGGLDIDPAFESDLPVCWWEVEQGASKTSDAKALYQELKKWSEKFCLLDEWLLDLALHTLFHWRRRLETAKPIALRWNRLTTNGMGLFDGQSESFTFNCGGWNLKEEDWLDYRKRLKILFEDSLSKYHRQAVMTAIRGGWDQAPAILDTRVRFKWLALWQVKRWSASEILACHPRQYEASNVAKQVTLAAKQAGVTLREPRKGRRRKPELA